VTLPRSVAEVLDDHVTFELECIDRMYLNLYQPRLMYPSGVAGFFKHHRGMPFVSGALMDPISKAFVAAIHRFIAEQRLDLVHFAKGQRKDDVAQAYLADHDGSEGVLFVGRAQEKASVFRTERRVNRDTGKAYPWLVSSTAMVNHFYFYAFDEGFGPFFIKFGTYFPYTAKVCLNGHHWAQRQAERAGIDFQAMDNAFASCGDLRRLQRICDGLSPARIEAFCRKWLRALPHPFTAADRRAGYRYDISVLQAEFSLTQMLDRPLAGRVFFEEVIRDNLDAGRPDQVSLTFERRIRTTGKRPTPGRFRTRVITEGVIPSIHVDYKRSRIKQYFKDNRALRTECTINDTRDFGIGRRLHNLPALRQVGFSANRRLLGVQRISCDPTAGATAYDQVCRPVVVDGQRAPALRFDHPTTQALLAALVVLRLLPPGFANRDLRDHLAPLLGKQPSAMTQGMMSYHLRRLRLHGLIERIPHTHRYCVTDFGLAAAVFLTRAHARFTGTGLDHLVGPDPPSPLRKAFNRIDTELDRLAHRSGLAA
jgi:hypothetical protein